MFIANDLKKLTDIENIDTYRENFVNILFSTVETYIEDKSMFYIDNFSAIYCDEYSLRTNCHSEIFSTIYLAIDQPLNYKEIKIKSNNARKEQKVEKPELYLTLEKIREDLIIILASKLDSNNIIYPTKYGFILRSSIESNGKTQVLFFNVLPCLIRYNSNNNMGIMYYSNSDIQIEYPDMLINNFNKKNKQTKDLYRQLVVMFKNILLLDEKIETLPSEIIETILYNVPNELFINDNIDTLLNIVNFIRNHNLKDFNTIDEQDKAFTSRYRSMSSIYVKHILKKIENYIVKNLK